MADIPTGSEGLMNGTTFVVVVPAPVASQQRILPVNGLSFYNADSIAHTYTVQVKKGASVYVAWVSGVIAAGGVAIMPRPLTLDATDETVEAKVDAVFATTESTFAASFVTAS